MVSNHAILNGALSLVLLGLAPFLSAQRNPVVVEESSAVSVIAPVAESFGNPVESGSDSIEGQYQLQLLQQEVMTLRGLVEELNYKIERLQETQDNRYLELDSRFQKLTSKYESQAPSSLTPTAEPLSDTAPIINLDEETLYDTALELIRNKQYELAVTQLRAVIDQYPNGRYTPNAYYWLGDVYIAMPQPQYEKARQALAQVIAFFPDHSKVPDATYKLGVVYNLMGNCARATEILKQVIREHQGRSVAGLAETHLRNKVNCGD